MTSLISRIETALHSVVGKKVESYIVSLGKAELKIVATSPLGVAALGAIKAGESGSTPVEKIGLGIAALLPFLTSEKPGALVADLETAARTIIEGVLAQLRQTGPLAIFEALISVAEAA